MCWGLEATVVMTAAGAVGTVVTWRRGDAVAIPLALGYFTLMELLQFAGYMVIDQCGTGANQTVTLLSVLHIIFQPLIINAFAMELVPGPVRARMRGWIFGITALCSLVMLVQLYPMSWAGICDPRSPLCGPALCTVSGVWHLAWDVPFNGMMLPVESALGLHAMGVYWGFPTYVLAVFVLPVVYGAWRFALMHMLAGPMLASVLTDNPNEVPAIWCLFSILLLAIALSPAIRRQVSAQPRPVGA